MSLSVKFLGTSASRPTVERGVSSLAIVREGETIMIDCGEGTQRQMMKYGVAFSLGDIFFTHFHTDHFLGVLGLLRTLTLQAREETLRISGPRGLLQMLKRADGLGVERLTFPLELFEVTPGELIKRKDYSILPFSVEHRASLSVGYALVEDDRRGVFDPDLARALGIPEGPLWGRIHKGEAITLDDGRVIEPSTLVGPTRSGRRVVVTNQSLVHQIMAAHSMIPIERVYGSVFENILGEKISTKPVDVVKPFTWMDKDGNRLRPEK